MVYFARARENAAHLSDAPRTQARPNASAGGTGSRPFPLGATITAIAEWHSRAFALRRDTARHVASFRTAMSPRHAAFFHADIAIIVIVAIARLPAVRGQ